MPTKKKKTKPYGVRQLKNDLWDLFTLYIKLKYSQDGWCRCFTCDKPIKIGTHDCQGGHYLNKTAHPIHYFDERNVRPQCGLSCNKYKQGNSAVFRERLIAEIGKEAVEDLEATKYQTCKRDRAWYWEKIKYYEEKIKEFDW